MKRSLEVLVVTAMLVVLAAMPALGLTSKVLVANVSPDGGSANVAASSNVKVTFNVRMNKSTINTKTFYLKRQGSTTTVPVQVSYRSTTKTATLNPNRDLAHGASYTAYVKGGRTGVRSSGGQRLGGTKDATATFSNARVLWTFSVATPPDTTIDSGPEGTVTEDSATFAFSSSKANSSFECSLDGAPFTECASPITVPSQSSLADGGHTFRVRAIDDMGSADPTPASRTWTVDTTGPAASITGGPSSITNSRSASFAFTGAEQGGGYECKIDSAGSQGAYSGCSSADVFTVQGDGSYTFSVRASDALGNFGIPASRSWTVDTVAPTVSDVSPLDGSTGVATNANVTAIFSEAMDSSTVSGQTFTLTPQGSSNAIGAQVTYDPNTRKATLDPSADLAPNTTYTATIAPGVKDSAGNTLAQESTWTFTTASALPTVVSHGPQGMGEPSTNVTATFSVPMNPTTITTQTFTLTRNGSTVPLPAQVTYDSASKTATLNPDVDLSDSTYYTAVVKGGSDGVKDLSGNSLAQNYSWTFMACSGGIILSPQDTSTVHPMGVVVCG